MNLISPLLKNKLRLLIVLSTFFLFRSLYAAVVDVEFYVQTNLVANNGNYNAVNIDSRLINPWGLTFSKHGNLIVADNGSSFLATSYNRHNGANSTFYIPGSYSPTGLVTNYNHDDFLIGTNPTIHHARLLFSTENGTIMAFNKLSNSGLPVVVIDRSSSDAIYKGLALGLRTGNTHQFIFATDFHNGNVDMFDYQFNYVGSFSPCTASNYAPFGISNIDGKLYITCALQDASREDDVPGPGHGYVSIYNTNGIAINSNFISQGQLNSPWGVALAPENFGPLGGSLLVGNFGDGNINAYDPTTGAFLGKLRDEEDQIIAIPGLWALRFYPHENRHPILYFTAGPNDELDGLVGEIAACR